MLPKKNRVDKKAFDAVFKKGRVVNSPNLTLRFILQKDSEYSRISFVVPKNVERRAVKRTLLRRRGYDIVQKYMKKFSAGFTGIFIFGRKSGEFFLGRKNKENNPIANLEYEIKNILDKIN